jgi:hypothetical protein
MCRYSPGLVTLSVVLAIVISLVASVRGNNAGSTPYKLLKKILAAIEAGSPRYFRVIFCVIQRHFPRQHDHAQVKSKLPVSADGCRW